MKRALTGIQPTNILHIGNYFGALLPAVHMQNEYQLSMMIADLHAITVAQKPDDLRKNTAFVAAAYLAAGIDPQKTVLFQHSAVPAHAELAWLLQCVARMGEVERMTQFKDKATSKGENVSVGLFTYPVLMAADILLYDTQEVPVGADQKQHVELARDLAERFNRDFGQTFVVPAPVIRKEGAKILGLDNPEKKMSKSAPSEKNYVSLMDSPDVITKKIGSAVTDSLPTVTADPTRLGVYNLLTLFALATDQTPERVAEQFANSGMKELKSQVAQALIAYIAPIQSRITDYLANPDALAQVIEGGNARANEIASVKVAQAKKAMGF